MTFLGAIDPWYKPIVELMLMTGMIHSEIVLLTEADIASGSIKVKRTMVRGRVQETPKTRYRIRSIPITDAINQRLQILIERKQSDLLFSTPEGSIINPANFRKTIWEKAQRSTGITGKVPYSLRHSFAAWALAVGIDMNRLVRLMGHGSKQMVYEVYGHYIEGLEEDREKIRSYLGEDFS